MIADDPDALLDAYCAEVLAEARRYAAALEAELCECQTVRQDDGSLLHAADCRVFAVQLEVSR